MSGIKDYYSTWTMDEDQSTGYIGVACNAHMQIVTATQYTIKSS